MRSNSSSAARSQASGTALGLRLRRLTRRMVQPVCSEAWRAMAGAFSLQAAPAWAGRAGSAVRAGRRGAGHDLGLLDRAQLRKPQNGASASARHEAPRLRVAPARRRHRTRPRAARPGCRAGGRRSRLPGVAGEARPGAGTAGHPLEDVAPDEARGCRALAASSHSGSVGRRRPAQRHQASASWRLTCSTGCRPARAAVRPRAAPARRRAAAPRRAARGGRWPAARPSRRRSRARGGRSRRPRRTRCSAPS
jgi:hypothetical protein